MGTYAWNKLRELFEQASALNGEARAAFLEQVRALDATLCIELETLLAASSEAPRGGGIEPSPPSNDAVSPPAAEAAAPARLFEMRSAGVTPANRPSSPAPVFRAQWAGRYLLLRRLGRGGMAEVFLARAHGPGGFERLVAVKRFVADYFGEEELRKRFEREAKVAASLHHPNIVHVYDFEETQGTYLLAMEYVKGRDLATILGADELSRRLPVLAAIHVVLQVAEALDYAFTREVEGADGSRMEVVHRDLSPRNIMIGFDGATKLVDFGIARARGRTALTEVGAIRGTLAYLAPEVAAGSPPSHQSDLFSLFVVLYESIAGEPLFDATHFATLLDQIAKCTLPETKVTALPVDDALKRILLRGLAKDPKHRYGTAAEVVQELDAYLRSRTQESPKQLLLRALQEYFAAARKEEDGANAAALELAKDIPPITLGNTTASRKKTGDAASTPVPRRLPPGFAKIEAPPPARPQPGPSKPEPIPPLEDLGEWKAPLAMKPRGYSANATRRVYPVLLAGLVAVGAIVWRERPRREPAQSSSVTPAPSSAPGGECLVSIESEPPGARVAIAGQGSGQVRTPTTLTVPCGSQVTATLRLDGYETDVFSVTAISEFQVARRRLKGVKPGQVELTLSHDATVMLDDEVLAEVGAGQPFELKLDSGKTYVFRFVNSALGIDFVERITVAPGGRTRKTISLVPH